jgi:hypothetical protein
LKAELVGKEITLMTYARVPMNLVAELLAPLAQMLVKEISPSLSIDCVDFENKVRKRGVI